MLWTVDWKLPRTSLKICNFNSEGNYIQLLPACARSPQNTHYGLLNVWFSIIEWSECFSQEAEIMCFDHQARSALFRDATLLIRYWTWQGSWQGDTQQMYPQLKTLLVQTSLGNVAGTSCGVCVSRSKRHAQSGHAESKPHFVPSQISEKAMKPRKRRPASNLNKSLTPLLLHIPRGDALLASDWSLNPPALIKHLLPSKLTASTSNCDTSDTLTCATRSSMSTRDWILYQLQALMNSVRGDIHVQIVARCEM